MSSAVALEVQDVSVRFAGLTAVSEVSFKVFQGTTCGLIGPNGAGKSTLFNAIGRLQRIDTGRVLLFGRDVTPVRPAQIAHLGVGRTFQETAVFDRLSVSDHVELAARMVRRENWRERAASALTTTGLADAADLLPDQLPYEGRKRLELARALALTPRLLMLDEPAAGLSHSESEALLQLLQRLRRETELTLLVVEHNMNFTMRLADKLVVLDFGKMIATGTPDEIRHDERVIQSYLGSAPR
ncbi:branched-chain amino acid transport system ATP-binding protein [Aquamicrobium terrae]